MIKERALDDLIIGVFRLNGRLIEAGNRLVAELGLTSALWQVLGTLDPSGEGLPVAHIARNMGLTRQSVQRVVDVLATKGLVRFEPNPHHRRAQLVVLTAEGRAAAGQALKRQRPWARELSQGISAQEITAALRVINHLNLGLAAQEENT